MRCVEGSTHGGKGEGGVMCTHTTSSTSCAPLPREGSSVEILLL